MKNLKGMKNTISSFENNKLANLELVMGGKGMYATETKPREASEPSNPNCAEYTCFMDNGKTKSIEIC